MSSADSQARRHLVLAKELLGELSTSARRNDLAQVRAALSHEISAALTALKGDDEPNAPMTESMRVRNDNQRGQILLALHRAGQEGRTDFDLQKELKMNPGSERARRLELVRLGYVMPKIVAVGPNLIKVIMETWVLTQDGAALASQLAVGAPGPARAGDYQPTLL